MKLPLIALLAALAAAPAVVLPAAPAEAQVLTGRNRAQPPRRTPRPRPRLSEAEQDRLYAAQDLILELDGQITDMEALGQSQDGGLTDAQRLQLDDYKTRRSAAQQTVEQLEAKLNR